MFDGIKFTHKETQRPIVSRSISPEVYKEDKYSSENLANSEFYIYGGIDAFLRPKSPTTQSKSSTICRRSTFSATAKAFFYTDEKFLVISYHLHLFGKRKTLLR